MTEQNPDLLALGERLPGGPWTAARQGDRLWYVEQDNADGLHIATANNERLARAIAAIPSMLEEIEQTRDQRSILAIGIADLTAANEGLRALITEMRETLIAWSDASTVDEAMAARIKTSAILAKTETDQ